MQEGIQSTLKNDILRTQGNYFLILLKLLEVSDGLSFGEDLIESYFKLCHDANVIDGEAFIKNEAYLLNLILGRNKYTRVIRGLKEKPKGLSIAIMTDKEGDAHFILELASNAKWDSLPVDREGVDDLKVSGYIQIKEND